MVHDPSMFASRTWLARRIGTWLDRWCSSLVMEAECDDGTRLLIGVDPSLHGLHSVAVVPVGGNEAEGRDAEGTRLDDSWVDEVTVPDDLRDLVP